MEILDIKRGDIFLVNTNYDFDTKMWIIKPFVVIQNDIANKYIHTVIMMAITSMIDKPKLPTHVGLPRELSGLENDSVALAEQVRTFDKRRLKTKIGELDSNFMLKIQKSMLVSIGDLVPKENFDTSHEVSTLDYKSYIKELTKPLILTEGKTDVIYLRTAWEKLYPNIEMYFDCKACGLQIEEEKRNGGVVKLRQTLDHISTIETRPVIGLFDNDRGGNTEFGGLSKDIFKTCNEKYNLKKHVERNIWGMLLPVPKERELFVTLDDSEQRYFVIEHYFTDDILKKHKMYGSNILGTSVFKVNNGKNEFSQEIKDLDSKEFENFKILFKEIDDIFKNINNK